MAAYATSIKYNEYDYHISNFDDKIYFDHKNRINDIEDAKFDDKIDNFYNFLHLYKKIEEEDLKKQTPFLNHHKTKKQGGGLNQSGYSYHVSNFVNQTGSKERERKQKVWNSHIPSSTDQKLHTLIDSYLNKISDESYKKISIEFMNELIKVQDLFYFDIITKKIIDKCVMDNKYQHLYIQLCNKIWTNRQIHYNLATIHESDKKYTWTHKYEIDGKRVYGPFATEMDAKMNIFYELNFKKYFMNYLQDLFLHKNVNFSHIENDDEFFLHKRQFMVIIEILGIMYMERFMPVDILHIVIMKLFHMNDMNMDIQSIEIDGILQIFKLMNKYKERYQITDYFKLPIFDEYFNYITQIEQLASFNMRTKYFLCDCKDILKGRRIASTPSLGTLETSVEKVEKVDEEAPVSVYEAMIAAKGKGELKAYYKNAKSDTIREDILYEMIYRYCESNMKDEAYEVCMNDIFDIHSSSIIKSAIQKIIMNMSDIILDIPDAEKLLKSFVEYTDGFHLFDKSTIDSWNELIETQMNIINSDDFF